MKRVPVALALALTIAFVSVVSAAPGPEDPGHHDDRSVDEVVLDPSAVHAALLEGRPFELPTGSGDMALVGLGRTQPSITYTDDGPDGPMAVTRAPNVWWVADEEGTPVGAVLSFDHVLRAWFHHSGGTVLLEPATAGDSATRPAETYRVTRLAEPIGSFAPAPEREDPAGDGVGILSHIAVFKDVYAYVDPEYRAQYGTCCWTDQVQYVLGLLNTYFDDVELNYRFLGGAVDSGFNTNNLNTAWNRLVSKPYNGADVKSYWSYRDFDGCDIGRATLPGSVFLVQHAPDWCHLNLLPGNDVERAYFTAHELGKNNNAHPNDHWSSTTWTGHEHRSIMDGSLWGHLHECWSSTNLGRMATYLGTSSVEPACS